MCGNVGYKIEQKEHKILQSHKTPTVTTSDAYSYTLFRFMWIAFIKSWEDVNEFISFTRNVQHLTPNDNVYKSAILRLTNAQNTNKHKTNNITT